MRRNLVLVLGLVGSLAAWGCSDSTEPAAARVGMPRGPRVDGAPANLNTAITQLIFDAFPKGLETAAGTRWDNVTGKLAVGDVSTARKMYTELAQWVLGKASSMDQMPGGETRQHVASRIVLYMSLYVFGGPNTPIPPVGDDIAVGFITPSAGGTIQTPSFRAGLRIPAGAVDQLTTVVVYQPTIAAPYKYCEGPLHTVVCQYPEYYKFEPFPYQILHVAGQFAVCHATSGEFAPTPEVHDRFRLAHDAPVPAGRNPNGKIIDGPNGQVEVLPLVNVGDLADCHHSSSVGSLDSPRFDNPFLQRGWTALASVTHAIGSVFAVKEAHAIDVGGGGESFAFSNFNVIDTVSSRFINFDPAPECDCSLNQEYSGRGVAFSFTPTNYEGSLEALRVSSTNNPTGVTNYALTAPNAPVIEGPGGPYLGTFALDFSAPVPEVRFDVRLRNADVPLASLAGLIKAYARDVQGQLVQVTSVEILTGTNATYTVGGVTYRQDGVTILAKDGVHIDHIEIDMSTATMLIDNLFLAPPPPAFSVIG